MGKKKIIVFAILGLVLLGLIFLPGYLKMRSLSQENRKLQMQIEQIRQANRRLLQEQENLKNDPLYLEKVAREKLGVVRKGEVVYIPRQEDR